ncbi:MAG: hypothetical protein R3B44_01895 [Candidatus Brocadiaceae bacterium]
MITDCPETEISEHQTTAQNINGVAFAEMNGSGQSDTIHRI